MVEDQTNITGVDGIGLYLVRMFVQLFHEEMLQVHQTSCIHLLVEPQLDDEVGEHAHAFHLWCHVVLAVHRVEPARGTARNVDGCRPVGGSSTGVQRVDLLHRPAAVVLVGVVVPGVAEVDTRNHQAFLAVEEHGRRAVAHRETAEADAIAILA